MRKIKIKPTISTLKLNIVSDSSRLFIFHIKEYIQKVKIWYSSPLWDTFETIEKKMWLPDIRRMKQRMGKKKSNRRRSYASTKWSFGLVTDITRLLFVSSYKQEKKKKERKKDRNFIFSQLYGRVFILYLFVFRLRSNQYPRVYI